MIYFTRICSVILLLQQFLSIMVELHYQIWKKMSVKSVLCVIISTLVLDMSMQHLCAYRLVLI